LSLQALIATNEGELREAGARNARAARAMEEARRELQSLDSNKKVSAEQELAEIDRQIATAQIDADAAKTSIEQMTGVPAELAAKGTETELVYTIMRNKQGQSTSVDATETSRLEPGDVVRISVRPRSPTEPASSQQRAENQAN
jgi:polysaccharide export outer membrane protein